MVRASSSRLPFGVARVAHFASRLLALLGALLHVGCSFRMLTRGICHRQRRCRRRRSHQHPVRSLVTGCRQAGQLVQLCGRRRVGRGTGSGPAPGAARPCLLTTLGPDPVLTDRCRGLAAAPSPGARPVPLACSPAPAPTSVVLRVAACLPAAQPRDRSLQSHPRVIHLLSGSGVEPAPAAARPGRLATLGPDPVLTDRCRGLVLNWFGSSTQPPLGRRGSCTRSSSALRSASNTWVPSRCRWCDAVATPLGLPSRRLGTQRHLLDRSFYCFVCGPGASWWLPFWPPAVLRVGARVSFAPAAADLGHVRPS